MKHLKKIFENITDRNEQREEIECIFYQWIDKKYIRDGEEYSDAEIDDTDDQYLLVSIYDTHEDTFPNDITEFDKMYKEREESLKLIKSIRVALIRLDYLEFKDVDTWHIKVYYKDSNLSLQDAFGGIYRMDHVDENIMKTILKRDYDIDYSSSSYTPSSSGYYGKRAVIRIWFKSPIKIKERNDDNKLIKDLKSLRRKNRRWEADKSYQAFYDVKFTPSLTDDGSGITIELD